MASKIINPFAALPKEIKITIDGDPASGYCRIQIDPPNVPILVALGFLIGSANGLIHEAAKNQQYYPSTIGEKNLGEENNQNGIGGNSGTTGSNGESSDPA